MMIIKFRILLPIKNKKEKNDIISSANSAPFIPLIIKKCLKYNPKDEHIIPRRTSCIIGYSDVGDNVTPVTLQ